MAETPDYKKTILLPKTDFPMKANLAQKEPEILKRWSEENVYERVLEARDGGPEFLFHDGPPYANGNIHYGHILNKVLKDIVVKYQNLAGRKTRFVPGWDCHGLPIELNVERAVGRDKMAKSKAELRAACRVEADKWVGTQREQFKRLGVFATWDAPYKTMDPSYERGIVETLASFLAHGIVYRGKKPVYWCGTDRTALAEAEVEYAPHTSPSVYVKFPLLGEEHAKVVALAKIADAQKPIHALIWTTTPWTLPSNLAISVHPEFAYQLLDVGAEYWLVAKEMSERVLKATKHTGSLAGETFAGATLAGVSPRHPFEDRASPFLTGDHVTLEAGTGLVHTAPGHGMEDYIIGRAHGLEPFAPLDDSARFTSEVREEWRGKTVYEVNPLVVALLVETGMLANSPNDSIGHSYPHCWRCKKPVIFRATTQWFIALDEPMQTRADKKTLRQVALDEIEAIASARDLPSTEASGFIPAWGRDRIHGMIKDRPDWCVSRQRTWGVPIPAFHCRGCGHVALDEKIANHVAEIFGKEGADVWASKEASELIPTGLTCTACGKNDFDKDPNILDVWFESGASFWSVMHEGAYGHTSGLPKNSIDLYLEGSDQHRGWFHSSLLVGAAKLGRAPYKRVLTHGFVCDDQGRPYSKSDIRRRQEAGEKVEYIDPLDIIKEKGAELLRLWAAYEDYRSDVRYSKEHLAQVSDAYFKVRNTLRFMLGCVGTGTEDPANIDPLDAWARARLRKYLNDVVAAYESFDFRTVYHRTVELCVGDWSSFYLDVLKDRLYCDGVDSERRRSAQSTVALIARNTIAAIAPILCFTADEAWRYLPNESQRAVFLGAKLEPSPVQPLDAKLLAAGETFFRLRDTVNLAMEPKVKSKEIAHRREVRATITLPENIREELSLLTQDPAELLAVSDVTLVTGAEISVTIEKTTHGKCARCWRHLPGVGSHAVHSELCLRCADVIVRDHPTF